MINDRQVTGVLRNPRLNPFEPPSGLSKFRQVLANTSYVAISEAAKPLISFFLVLVISRRLGQEGMGAYTIILSFTALFELLATAGLPPVMVRGIAADCSKLAFYATGGAGMAVISSCVVVPVTLIAVKLLNYPADISFGIRILSLTIVLTTLQQYAVAVCEGLQNMKLRALVSTSETAGRLVAGVFMLLRGYGIVGVIEAIIVVRFLTTILAFAIVRRYLPRLGHFDLYLSLKSSYQLLLVSLPFLLTTIANTAFWSTNTLLLSKIVTVADVGVYNAAYRIMDILKNIFYSYLIVVLPMMATSFARSKHDLEKDCNVSVKYLSLFTVPVAAGISVLSPRIILLVYGSRFDAAVPMLRILIWTVCAFSLVLVFARILVASHNQISDLYCNIAALVVNLIAGWILIHHYGTIGAGIATLVSLLVFGALEYLVVTKRLFRPVVLSPLIRAGAASLIMVVVISRLDKLSLGAVICLGGMIYLVCLLASKTFSAEELHVMRAFVRYCMSRAPGVQRREENQLVS